MNKFKVGDKVTVDGTGPFFVEFELFSSCYRVNTKEDFSGYSNVAHCAHMEKIKEKKVEEVKKKKQLTGNLNVLFLEKFLEDKNEEFNTMIREWIDKEVTYGDASYTLIKLPVNQVFNLFSLWKDYYPNEELELEAIKLLAENYYLALNG